VEERNHEHNDGRHPSKLNRKKGTRLASVPSKKTAVCVIAVSGVVLLVSASYSFPAMNADNQLNKAFVAANQGNLDQVMTGVHGATSGFDPAGDRAFVAARALTLCAEKVQALRESSGRIDDDNLARSKATAIEAATTHAGRSLAHTLTPDSNYLLLAYLASLSGFPWTKPSKGTQLHPIFYAM